MRAAARTVRALQPLTTKMISRLTTYLNRSSRVARDATARGTGSRTGTTSIIRTHLSSVLQMQGAEQPSRAPLTLFTLNTPEAIKDYAYGCDADVGGTSTVFFDFDDDPAHKPPPPSSGDKTKNKLGAARFHGHMSLAVRPGYEDSIRGGYAGFRNKVRWVLGPLLKSPPSLP